MDGGGALLIVVLLGDALFRPELIKRGEDGAANPRARRTIRGSSHITDLIVRGYELELLLEAFLLKSGSLTTLTIPSLPAQVMTGWSKWLMNQTLT